MTTVRGTGAPICARCGARADARRGPTPMCLSCGHPFPQNAFANASRGGSSLLVPIIIGAVLATAMIFGTAAVVIARADKKVEAPSVADANVTAVLAVAESRTAVDAAASASAAPASAPLTNEELDRLDGNYRCAMDDTPLFPCRIANGRLEKLGGSQRFRGPIRKLANGNLEFSGDFFCPFGACDHPVATTFVRQGPGRYVGKFGPNSIRGGGPGGERVVLNKTR